MCLDRLVRFAQELRRTATYAYPGAIFAGLLALIAFTGGQALGQDSYELLLDFQERLASKIQTGKLVEAEQIAQEMVARADRDFSDQPKILVACLNKLADLYRGQGRDQESEQAQMRAVGVWLQAVGPDSPEMIDSLNRLAETMHRQARYAEAERVLKRALGIAEKAMGPEHRDTAQCLNNLAMLYQDQGRAGEAEKLVRRALAINEKEEGPESRAFAGALYNLANVCQMQGKYKEAESNYKRSLGIFERMQADHPRDLANVLNNLASLYFVVGRYAECEALEQRALAIRQKDGGEEHIDVADSLNGLANVTVSQGRYAEGVQLYQRALAILERAYGPEHHVVAGTLNNLSVCAFDQGNYPEAERIALRALRIREKGLGPDHLDVAQSLANLANVLAGQKRYDESLAMYRRSAEIFSKHLGADHAMVAQNTGNIALNYLEQNNLDEAERLFRQAVGQYEKLAAQSPALATSLANLATVKLRQGKPQEAEPLAERALVIRDRSMESPAIRAVSYLLRARIGWALGRKSEAVTDLKRAMELSEEQRGQASGGEQDRAAVFEKLSDSFEQMVAWQCELGDASEALAAIERSRARSLLDEMVIGGADLSLARSAADRQCLRNEEIEISTRIAELETQAAGADSETRRAELDRELAAARNSLYEHHRQERATNPLYQNLLSANSGPPHLSQLQQSLAAGETLVLMYLLGAEGGYVLSVDSAAGRLTKLQITPDQAQQLACTPGPLTDRRLSKILITADGQGVIQQLAANEIKPLLITQLSVLWESLIPPAEREALLNGKYKRLIVVPDSALALLPFETLVVDTADPAKYLLDAGPPILCAPSATVLYNLLQRPKDPAAASVLTVGDPAYGNPQGSTNGSARGSNPAQVRYRSAGGELTRLPYSKTESQWVAQNFSTPGITMMTLRNKEATESNVRAAVAGRQVLHLACHGLTDQSYSNFFGALALTPGAHAASDPADDGFLSLPEIYGLDLKQCELAILSACETNYGPQQKGEGVWALSRGFIVAGARRVVASNWLVDDEAAASLVSYFTAGVAQAEKQGKPVDYADSLQSAKRWVRGQQKWQSPYYWGTFVLVGPQ